MAKGAKLNTFEIVSVRNSSPGEKAGILEGDMLIMVNGNLTSELSLNVINGLLNSKPGKKVTVVIERNKVRYTIQLALEVQI